MAWLKNPFKKEDKLTAAKLINLLNQGYSILQINRQIYDIPEIRTAINFVAEKIASVPFYHIRADTEGNTYTINDSINYVLTVRANEYQSPQVFWTQAITILLVSNNTFIMPEWDSKGRLMAWYILPFTQFEFFRDDNGKMVITFQGNSQYSFYYDDIIHLHRFPTFKGGAPKQATGNYTTIVGTMQNQVVKDSESSGRIAALLQVKSQLKASDMKKKLDEFAELFATSNNTTGFGMIGGEYDVHNLNMNLNPMNTTLLTEITKQLYNYFSVSYEIINGTADELQYEQWVDGKAKPIIYQIEEECLKSTTLC